MASKFALTLTNGAAAAITVSPGQNTSLQVSVGGQASLDVTAGVGATADVVVAGNVGSNLFLSGVMNFGNYVQNGGTLSTRGMVFVDSAVTLNCAVGPSSTNTQIGGVSGAVINVNGPVADRTEFVMMGTGHAARPGSPGGAGLLVVAHSATDKGNASLDDSAENFRDLTNTTGYRILTGRFDGGAANTEVQLFSGNRLTYTALLAEPGGHRLSVGVNQFSGTYIYDAGAANAMAGFGLRTLHAI